MLAPTIGTKQQKPKPTKIFRPLPWQVAPWRDKWPVMVLTGSAGGGKSHLSMEKVNGFCLKYPGAFAVLARKVRASMTSGAVLFFEDEVSVTNAESIFAGATHYPSKSRFEYPNGSMVVYLGLQNNDARQRLKSIGRKGGVDIALMEEGTEFDEADFNAMTARMRGRAATWQQIIIPTNPDAPTHWIYTRLIQGGEASVYYSTAADNTYNPANYIQTLNRLTGVDKKRLAEGMWVQAAGLVYGEVWSDGPADGNVTEAAEYQEGHGRLYWAVDDGYSAGSKFPNGIDPQTRTYTADAHPRAILLFQMRPNGQLCLFEEILRVKTLEEAHVKEVLELGYPLPDYAAVDSSAAQLRGRLNGLGIYTRKATHQVEEGIKELRRWLAADENGFRKLIVHPRCKHYRKEMVSYRYDEQTGKPVKEFDHGPDAGRYLTWTMRHE